MIIDDASTDGFAFSLDCDDDAAEGAAAGPSAGSEVTGAVDDVSGAVEFTISFP